MKQSSMPKTHVSCLWHIGNIVTINIIIIIIIVIDWQELCKLNSYKLQRDKL